jgi:hypothetical protein
LWQKKISISIDVHNCRGKRCHKFIGKKEKGRYREDDMSKKEAVYFPHLAAGKTEYRKYQYDV